MEHQAKNESGFQGTWETLERIHMALKLAGWQRKAKNYEGWWDEVLAAFLELDGFLNETESKEEEKLRLQVEPFVKTSGMKKTMMNTKKIEDMIFNYERYVRKKLHKYNLLIPKGRPKGIL